MKSFDLLDIFVPISGCRSRLESFDFASPGQHHILIHLGVDRDFASPDLHHILACSPPDLEINHE